MVQGARRPPVTCIVEGRWDGGDDSDTTYVPSDTIEVRLGCSRMVASDTVAAPQASVATPSRKPPSIPSPIVKEHLMKDTVIRFFGRTISSNVFDMKLGQAVCYVASVVMLFTSWWKLTKLDLGEAQLFFGLLLSFCPPLLLVIIGLLLPRAPNAWKQHT